MRAIRRHHAPGLAGEHLKGAFTHVNPVEPDPVKQTVAGYLRVVAGHASNEITLVVTENIEPFGDCIDTKSDTRVRGAEFIFREVPLRGVEKREPPDIL